MSHQAGDPAGSDGPARLSGSSGGAHEGATAPDLPPRGVPPVVPSPLGIRPRSQVLMVGVAAVGTLVIGGLLWWLLVAVIGWADRARPATCVATRCFCEAVREGAIAQPANTVSSLAYVLVGLWAGAAIAAARASRRSGGAAVGRLIPWLALVVALIGVSSAFFHATLTFLGQYLDVLSMYLLGALLLCGALVRRGTLRASAAVALFGGAVAALAVAQYAYPESRRVLFALVLLPGILLELPPRTCGLSWRDPRRTPLWTGLGLLVAGYSLWVLDQRGVLCWPDSLLQGHAAWHTLTAASAVMLVLHYGVTGQTDPLTGDGAGQGGTSAPSSAI